MPVGGLSRAWQIISRMGSFNRRILFRRGTNNEGSILIIPRGGGGLYPMGYINGENS